MQSLSFYIMAALLSIFFKYFFLKNTAEHSFIGINLDKWVGDNPVLSSLHSSDHPWEVSEETICRLRSTQIQFALLNGQFSASRCRNALYFFHFSVEMNYQYKNWQYHHNKVTVLTFVWMCFDAWNTGSFLGH